jgi:YVTN family beta-propeller protein
LKRHPRLLASAALGLLVVSVGGGCNFGQTGIAPPTNRIFLPAGIAVDPDGNFLYVVNSNSDLRFNAGTLVAVDLSKTAPVLAKAASDLPICSKTRFSRTEDVASDYCCRDLWDSNIVNCHESQFIQDDATVEIGSFGGPVALQTFKRNGVLVRRLFVAVRAEPSVTYADAIVSEDGAMVAMRCSGPHNTNTPAVKNAFCEDDWKIRRPAGATPGSLALPEEPHVLALDTDHQALFVGHLTVTTTNQQVQGGGVSSIDICNPEHDNPVRFAGLARTTFLPAAYSQAVGALSAADPAQPSTVVYATARYSTAISGMVLRSPAAAACDNDATTPSSEARDLALVPSERSLASEFLPNGADVRGILFSKHGDRAYVLHRNDSDAIANPAALTVLDRRPLPDGAPANSPIAVFQVCNGPTGMQIHDAGRGDRIYVTCYDDGQIYVIDPVAMVVESILYVGEGPIGLVFSPRNKGVAYVASFANSHLSIIDLTPGSRTENRVLLRVGLPHGYGE